MSAGAVVGAVIGFFVGGPVGAQIGWMAGSLLFPPKGPDGPRLEDLRPQTSEYGRPLALIYGTTAIGGHVIWASDLVEVEGDSGGGKGGGESTIYSYFANFAVAICESDGDLQLGRIWAGPEKRLIWDGTLLEGEGEIRYYDGASDQLPDALIESYEGVGNVPAYRGTAYVVFENFPVVKDGNRIPFLTIEVGHIDPNTAPVNLGTVWPMQAIVTDDYYIAIYRGSFHGIIVRNLDDGTLVKHLTFDQGQWDAAAPFFFDEDRGVFVRPNHNLMTYTTIDIVTGAYTDHTITAAVDAEANPAQYVRGGVYHNGYYIFIAAPSASGQRTTLYLMDPDTHAPVFTYTSDVDGDVIGPLMKPNDASAWVYAVTADDHVKQYGLGFAAAPVDLGEVAPQSGVYAIAAVDPNTGFIWSASNVGAVSVQVNVNDPITSQSLIFTETVAAPITFNWDKPITFQPGLPNKVIINGNQWLGVDYFLMFNADVPELLWSAAGGYHGTSAIYVIAYNPVTAQLIAFRDGGMMTFADADDPLGLNFLLPAGTGPELDNKYMGEADGSLDPQGQSLSTIVADLSERAGLAADQIDVTQLEDDMVDGYAIASQTSVRDAITVLMPAYFFDAVESEGLVKFVKRGGAVAVEIPDEDVGSFEAGSEPVEPLTTKRRMENELPRSMTVRYILAATAYSPAARLAKRLIGASGEEASLELPIVMTDRKGQEVAEVNLHGEWMARLSYSYTLPRKYEYLEPTDVVSVYGFTMRIIDVKRSDGILSCSALHEDASVYTPNVVVTETPTAVGGPGGPVATSTETILELM